MIVIGMSNWRRTVEGDPRSGCDAELAVGVKNIVFHMAFWKPRYYPNRPLVVCIAGIRFYVAEASSVACHGYF